MLVCIRMAVILRIHFDSVLAFLFVYRSCLQLLNSDSKHHLSQTCNWQKTVDRVIRPDEMLFVLMRSQTGSRRHATDLWCEAEKWASHLQPVPLCVQMQPLRNAFLVFRQFLNIFESPHLLKPCNKQQVFLKPINSFKCTYFTCDSVTFMELWTLTKHRIIRTFNYFFGPNLWF